MARVAAMIMALLALGTAGMAGVGRTASEQTATDTDGGGLIGNSAGSLYFERRAEAAFALHVPGECSMESRSSRNQASKSWTTDVTLRPKGKPELMLRRDSSTPTRLTVNDSTFDLALGSFFALGKEGKVEQLPFAPLSRVDETYLDRLNKHLSR